MVQERYHSRKAPPTSRHPRARPEGPALTGRRLKQSPLGSSPRVTIWDWLDSVRSQKKVLASSSRDAEVVSLPLEGRDQGWGFCAFHQLRRQSIRRNPHPHSLPARGREARAVDVARSCHQHRAAPPPSRGRMGGGVVYPPWACSIHHSPTPPTSRHTRARPEGSTLAERRLKESPLGSSPRVTFSDCHQQTYPRPLFPSISSPPSTPRRRPAGDSGGSGPGAWQRQPGRVEAWAGISASVGDPASPVSGIKPDVPRRRSSHTIIPQRRKPSRDPPSRPDCGENHES
jgi:hypothetical protein